MALVNLTQGLKDEYQRLFNTCIINPDKLQEIEIILDKILSHKDRYEAVGSPLVIPWYFIAVIHSMESSINFSCHLHNGDPLTNRTVHVPAGRPVSGSPPFTWEESAADSLQHERLNKWQNWSLAGLLYKIEGYNGWGYRRRHPHVLSPYLWSFSNHYKSGKYIADGRWSDTAVSNQCGAAVLLRRLAERKDIDFAEHIVKVEEPMLKYSEDIIQFGKELQEFLNKFPGIYVNVDGKPGQKTSEAFKKVTGYYLKGDSRI